MQLLCHSFYAVPHSALPAALELADDAGEGVVGDVVGQLVGTLLLNDSCYVEYKWSSSAGNQSRFQ